MSHFKMVVLTNPREGQDDGYNDWYSNVHLQDVTAVPGFLSAQRFRLRHPMGFDHQWSYLSIYEVETDDVEAAVADLLSRQGTDDMAISEALDLEGAVAGVFEACSPVVASGHKLATKA